MSEPSESTPPSSSAPNTPPASATGRKRKKTVARRQFRNAACSRSRIPIATASAKLNMRSSAASRSADSPSTAG
jgi:hypothetical protein